MSFLADLRHGARQLARSPGFTLVAALTLALGIGANTVVFSLVNAVFLRPLPVHRPSEIVRVYANTTAREGGGGAYHTMSYPDYRELAGQKDLFAGLATWGGADVSIGAGDRARMAKAALVSGNFFEVLGVRAAMGRALTPADDATLLASPVVVLSHHYWRDAMAADPSVVGSTITVNGRAFTVIGVAQPEFRGLELEGDIAFWAPMAMTPWLRPEGGAGILTRNSSWLRVIGRPAPGVDVERLQGAASQVATRLAAAHPETNESKGFTVEKGGTYMGGGEGEEPAMIFTLISAIVALVLLIACANVANLLLARATARRREIAVRLSIGASRGRVVRQLLTESVMLALIGGVVGLLFASWGAGLVKLLDIPEAIDLRPDGRVLAYVAGLSMLSGIVFGLAPALQFTRPDLIHSLRDGGPGAGRSRSRLRSGLVITQVALSLVLLVAAGLLTRTMIGLRTAPSGFDDERVLLAEIDLATQNLDSSRVRVFRDEVMSRVRALPGVQSASLAPVAPFTGREYNTVAGAPGSAVPPDRPITVGYTPIGDRYFETIGLPLVRGRAVLESDRQGAPRVAVVNETFARVFWPNEDAIGRSFTLGSNEERLTVVGIARDVAYGRIGERPKPMFFPSLHQSNDRYMTLHVRAASPLSLVTPLRAIIREVAPDLPLGETRTLADARRSSLMGPRIASSFFSAFGGIALLLAAVGLAGVVAFTVAQRTHEIGVRMALGADGGSVLRLMVGQGMRLAFIGIAIGTVLAFGVARLLESLLYGVGSADPLTFGAVALVLGTATLLATWLPARRAARVDPVRALRAE